MTKNNQKIKTTTLKTIRYDTMIKIKLKVI